MKKLFVLTILFSFSSFADDENSCGAEESVNFLQSNGHACSITSEADRLEKYREYLVESDYLKYVESENGDVIESYTCTHPTAKTTLLNVTISGSDLKTRISLLPPSSENPELAIIYLEQCPE